MRAEFRETVRGPTRRKQQTLRASWSETLMPRLRFSQDVSALRPRAVAKLMFMHMLGYPTHFGQMECLKLLSSTSYAEKARLCSCAPLRCLLCADAASLRSGWGTWA